MEKQTPVAGKDYNLRNKPKKRLNFSLKFFIVVLILIFVTVAIVIGTRYCLQREINEIEEINQLTEETQIQDCDGIEKLISMVAGEKNLQLSFDCYLAEDYFKKGIWLRFNGASAENVIKLFSDPAVAEKVKNLELESYAGLRPDYLKDEGIKLIIESKKLDNLLGLSLEDQNITIDGAKVISENNGFQNLRYMNLSNNEIRDEGIKYLSDSLNFPSLESLILEDVGMTNVGAEYLSKNNELSSLRILSLSNNYEIIYEKKIESGSYVSIPVGSSGITGLGVKFILESNNLPNLEALSLANLQMGEQESVVAFAHVENSQTKLKPIKYLDISSNNMKPEGMRAIANNPHFKNLAYLNASSNGLGKEGLLAIANSENFKHLTHLLLAYNYRLISRNGACCYGLESYFDQEAMKALAESKYLKNLQSLVLTLNTIETGALELLSESKNFQNLSVLSLGKVNIENGNLSKELKFIANSKNFVNLKELYLSRDPATDFNSKELVSAISDGSSFKNLEVLNLSYTNIDDNGIEILSRSPYLKNLKSLNLTGGKITNRGINLIATSENFSQLEFLNLWETNMNDLTLRTILESGNFNYLKTLKIPEYSGEIKKEIPSNLIKMNNNYFLLKLWLNFYDKNIKFSWVKGNDGLIKCGTEINYGKTKNDGAEIKEGESEVSFEYLYHYCELASQVSEINEEFSQRLVSLLSWLDQYKPKVFIGDAYNNIAYIFDDQENAISVIKEDSGKEKLFDVKSEYECFAGTWGYICPSINLDKDGNLEFDYYSTSYLGPNVHYQVILNPSTKEIVDEETVILGENGCEINKNNEINSVEIISEITLQDKNNISGKINIEDIILNGQSANNPAFPQEVNFSCDGMYFGNCPEVLANCGISGKEIVVKLLGIEEIHIPLNKNE